MTAFFTADTHFGHKRAIDLCLRPFHSVEEMDETMIDRWNARVRQNDTVYHLGDFAFCDHTPLLSRLNGNKILIVGNHDNSKRVKAAHGWMQVESLLRIKMDGQFIILCHYGMRVWERSHYGSLHFYGHSHGNLPGNSQSCDVGVDVWDYRPVSMDEIMVRLATLPPYVQPDHHAMEERDGVA